MVSALFLLIDSKTVFAQCSGTDTYTLNVHNPDDTLLRSDSQTISDLTGDNCDSATSNEAKLSVSCSRGGNYTANITCDGCTGSGHSLIDHTTVLFCYNATLNKFLIRNASGTDVAAFDEKGYVYLRGFNYTNQEVLSPPPSSYVIRNNSGETIAYIDFNGSFYMKGSILMSQATISPPPSSFVIRNSSGNDVAYVNNTGDLILSGLIYHNWTDPI